MFAKAHKLFALLNRTFNRPERLRADSTEPVARQFGVERGTPIDRFYIERFLDRRRNLIRGKVLEIADNTYSKRFGGDAVGAFEILHVNDHPDATIVGDLTDPATLPAGRVDCFICTQTFNFIYDFHGAIRGAHHLLAPGGVVLVTLAGISQISRYDADRWGDFWRFTPQSALRAFEAVFGRGNVEVDFEGNVYAATNLLRGLALEEVLAEKLDAKDADYLMTITVIARKPAAGDAPVMAPAGTTPGRTTIAPPLALFGASAWAHLAGAFENAVYLSTQVAPAL